MTDTIKDMLSQAETALSVHLNTMRDRLTSGEYSYHDRAVDRATYRRLKVDVQILEDIIAYEPSSTANEKRGGG